jgi:uncharacterized protein (DUF4415 family)
MKKHSKTDWVKVNALTDDTIDYSDSPEVIEDFFKIMTKREPEKVLVNIRLNREVVDFFKQHSNKYQTKINEVLLSLVHSYRNLIITSKTNQIQ